VADSRDDRSVDTGSRIGLNAVASSGFIPWPLAFTSFALILVTKLPLALPAGRGLERRG
jgi:hypothetical protein